MEHQALQVLTEHREQVVLQEQVEHQVLRVLRGLMERQVQVV